MISHPVKASTSAVDLVVRCCVLAVTCVHTTHGWQQPLHQIPSQHVGLRPFSPFAASSRLFSSATDETNTKQSDDLARILTLEYTTFFDPFYKDRYSPTVRFADPLTTLTRVDAYQGNVDMLAGRTLLGKIIFGDSARINLHSVERPSPSEIRTRWTLQFAFGILPWKPVARFSGISVYSVDGNGLFATQDDYWDSVNLQSDGTYQAMDRGVALRDFLGQLAPSSFQAAAAAPEVPYELLRRASNYEVRRYPAMVVASLDYERRDEGYEQLGRFCQTNKLNPLAPAILTVSFAAEKKSMMWPVGFAMPGETEASLLKNILSTGSVDVLPSSTVKLVSFPSRVVAVGTFTDASVEAVVRKCRTRLTEVMANTGLSADTDNLKDGTLQFCQYDAIFSMGQRRGESWVDLSRDHPWATR